VTNGSGGPQTVWLVQGEDPSLVREAVSGVLKQLLGGVDPSLALEELGTDDLDLAAVADRCRTPPFLADHRVVVVRDIGRFSLEQVQPLLDYLGDPSPTTRLVLAAGEGQTPAKLVSAVKQAGTIISTDVRGKEAHGWLMARLANAPVRLSPPATQLLEAHLGEDLNRLSAVLSTLEGAYGLGARLGPEELTPYLGRPGSVPPWDLTDAIDGGKTEAAIVALHRLLEAGERHPLVVFAILQRHFANALAVQSPDVRSEAQAAEVLEFAKGRSTFPARKALDTARRLGPRGTGDAILALAEAELQLKGKIDWPAQLVLEVLVARLCRLSRARPGSAR
jgi:DNA polymerase-3 subunit delta